MQPHDDHHPARSGPGPTPGRIFGPHQLAAAGVDWRARRRAEADGQLRRMRRGYYTDAPAVLAWSPEDRENELLLATLAAAQTTSTGTVFSHESALALHGLPLVGLVGARPVCTRHRPGGGSRKTPLLRCHNVSLGGSVTERSGVPVTTVARALVDVARAGRGLTALCAADAALHLGLCTDADITDELRGASGRKGVGAARDLLPHANGAAESPLESLSRFHLIDHGLPEPELQARFVLPGGGVARADLFWRSHKLIGECDGLGKYGIDEHAVRSSLAREKNRENDLARLGIRVVRWTWDDAWKVEPMIDRVRAAFHLQENVGIGRDAA